MERTRSAFHHTNRRRAHGGFRFSGRECCSRAHVEPPPRQPPWEPDGLSLRRIRDSLPAGPAPDTSEPRKRHYYERTNPLVLGGDRDVGGFSIAKRGRPHYGGFVGGFGGGRLELPPTDPVVTVAYKVVLVSLDQRLCQTV
ncbi:hypothetical protein U1Q18_015956 [Sarracenia purpurea var. burkii]